MWQDDVLRLINDWLHKTKLIDSRYWSCPTLDNPMLQQGLTGYNNSSGYCNCLVSANDFFVEIRGLGKLLILIDEYPPTWEILEHYTRGMPKDILIVKIETPKLA